MIGIGEKRGSSLPLGVDLGPFTVSIVAASSAGGEFSVGETRTLDIPDSPDGCEGRAIAETIRSVASELSTKERRCVLGAPSGESIMRIFRVPPNMRRREADRAAELEADAIVDWPASERLIALDPIPARSGEMLLSIARNSTIERLVEIARAGGLRPIAVDTAACAWRRAVPDADAILDCRDERATLEIFGDPIGATHRFPPRLIDERLAAAVRSALVDARRDGVADAQRIAVLAQPLQFESLGALLSTDGYTIAPVTFGTAESPSWSLAYGLATWSIARLGLRAS